MLDQLGASEAAARGHQEVYTYWASLREGGRLPARSQIDPWALKRFLPTVSLIDVFSEADETDGAPRRVFRQRLAGTGLYAVYGREITGRRLEEVYPEPVADYWREQLETVVRTGRPAVGCQPLGTRRAVHSSILWIRLPLASDGVNVDMILGYDNIVGAAARRDASGIRAA